MYLGFLSIVFTAVSPVTQQPLTHRRHSGNSDLLKQPAVVSFIFSFSLFLLSILLISVLTYLLSSSYLGFNFFFFSFFKMEAEVIDLRLFFFFFFLRI